MTQTIPYREGKHFGTLSIDMNDPEDAIFIEQFKRIPSKNRDYIAALYAREKRRGVNRHIGDHIQPLSLTKQIDEPDVQKSRLTIDKNALMETLRRIDEKVQEIQADIDSGKRTKEDADIELKALAAEREKIKARADELGIKLAALSAKSSTNGTSPLKPDQLVTIIKKLQEQGNAPDLSAVLNKIENLRLDSGGMMNYIAALIDIIDKTFTYTNGKRLYLSKVKDGLELLNKAMSDRRITTNKTQTRQAINEALATIVDISNVPVTSITTKSGIDMSFGVATALYKRLFGSLLMAIDFDFKDIDPSNYRSEYIDNERVIGYLKEIHSAVDDSMHIYTGFPSVTIPDEELTKYSDVADKTIQILRSQSTDITSTNFGDKKSSFGLNVCAVLLGIKRADDAKGFPTVYGIRNKLIAAYNKNRNTEEAYNAFKSINAQSNYTKDGIIATAFRAVHTTVRNITTELAEIKEISVIYNQNSNSITVNNLTLPTVFIYGKPPSGASKNMIFTAITKEDIIEALKQKYLQSNIIKERITVPGESVSISPAIPEEEEDTENKLEEEEEEEAKPDEEETKSEEEEEEVKPAPKKRVKKVDNFGEGIAGYIKIIDRGNPLKRRYRW